MAKQSEAHFIPIYLQYSLLIPPLSKGVPMPIFSKLRLYYFERMLDILMLQIIHSSKTRLNRNNCLAEY